MVFCFDIDRTIPIIFFNILGCVYNSLIAIWGLVYEKLGRVYKVTGAKCTVDSAFDGTSCKFLSKSSQDMMVSTEPTLVCRVRDTM